MTTVITVILCVIAMIVAAVIASIVSVNRFKKSAEETLGNADAKAR